MAFKTRRQQRYNLLRKAGFLPFEAQALSKIPARVPYMDVLIRHRWQLFQKTGGTYEAVKHFADFIRKQYIDSGWLKKTKLGNEQYDPYKMLKDSEAGYRAKHPEYTSPWEKRRKDWQSTVKKIEQSYKYPRNTPTARIRYLPGGGAELV